MLRAFHVILPYILYVAIATMYLTTSRILCTFYEVELLVCYYYYLLQTHIITQATLPFGVGWYCVDCLVLYIYLFKARVSSLTFTCLSYPR